MKITLKTDSLAPAFRSAWRKRYCPPHQLLNSGDDPNIPTHLKVCEECRDLAHTLQKQPDFFVDFAPLERLAASAEENPSPQPGEIWSLREGLECWLDEAHYANAPLVLVMERIADLPGAVQVVQICSDPDLRGPGDVLIVGEDTIAEAWNTYTLDIQAFKLCLGSVSPKELGQVQDMSRVSEGVLPGSMLDSFRQMEMNIGWHFHSQCLPWLIGRHEALATEPEEAVADDQRGWWEHLKEDLYGVAARTFQVPEQLAAIPGEALAQAREMLLAFLEPATPEACLSALGDCINANYLRADGTIVQESLIFFQRESNELGTRLTFALTRGVTLPLSATAFRNREGDLYPEMATECSLEQEGEKIWLTILFPLAGPDFDYRKDLRIALETPPPPQTK